jgi:hypothetical protein
VLHRADPAVLIRRRHHCLLEDLLIPARRWLPPPTRSAAHAPGCSPVSAVVKE